MKRALKILVFVIGLIVLQLVILPRINLWGIFPDLFLVTVIILAVLERGLWTIFFAFVLSLLQDCFSPGLYINAMTKTLLAGGVVYVRQSYLGDEMTLMLVLVAVMTPLVWLIQLALVWTGELSLWFVTSIIIKILLTMLYNLIFVPFIFRVTRSVFGDD